MSYKYSAGCFIKGKIDSMEKKEFKSKNGGDDFEILDISVKSDGNRIRGKIMNPKDNKNFINEFMRDFKRDDVVGVSGRLVERTYKTKDGRDAKDTTPIFYKVIDGSVDDKESSTFMIQGFVARVKELDSGDYKIYFDTFNETKEGLITLDTFETEASEDVVSEMYDQGFEEKAFVKVAGHLVNKFILDDFNQVVDSERGLKIAKMYSCVVPDEVPEAEMDLYNEVKKAFKLGKKVSRKTADEDAEEEKPKGKRKRSTFDEDED